MKRIDVDGEMLSSMMPTIGWTALIISVLMAVAFYIWPINHPRFKAWWAWMIMIAINAAINFGLTFAFLSNRIASIKNNTIIFDEFADTNGNFSIAMINQISLATANACVSILFFCGASLILTWFSSNCKYSPFRA
ncbi:MAG: hypothetical protein K2M31_03360 [Muribaculaceae bacterium]|nr:hypothetical protein [Muribaculaceae bacterium]